MGLIILLVRLGVDDLLPGGTTLEEGCIVAQKLQEAGMDICQKEDLVFMAGSIFQRH